MTPADLRTARKRLGYTQHSLAKALHMGKWGFQTIHKWENGKSPIPADLHLKLAGLEALRGNMPGGEK